MWKASLKTVFAIFLHLRFYARTNTHRLTCTSKLTYIASILFGAWTTANRHHFTMPRKGSLLIESHLIQIIEKKQFLNINIRNRHREIRA